MMGTLGRDSGDPKYNRMEEQLAREMARMKMTSERTTKEVEKICEESDEIKALKARINEAYLNKERVGQMAEKQYRTTKEIEEDAHIDRAMLRQKEMEDRANRQRLAMERENRVKHKQDLQTQMVEREQLRAEAIKEYEREKQNVEKVIESMIQEDQQMQ